MARAIDTAYVDILPDLSKFEREADKQFAKAAKNLEKTAKDSADEIDRSFTDAADDIDKKFNDVIVNLNTKTKTFEVTQKRAADSLKRDLGGAVKDIGKDVENIKPLRVPVVPELDPAAISKFTRDAQGRLRDERGKFISEGKKLGDGFGDGLLGGVSSKLAGLGGILKNILGAVGAAAAGQAAAVAASIGAALIPAAGFLAAALPAAALTATVAIKTLTLAFSGFDEVVKNLDDPEKFAEALENLSPRAQAFAFALRDIKPAFDAIKFSVQDAVFAGLDAELRTVAATLSGPLKTGLTGIGQEFNAVGKEIANFAKSSSTVSTLNSFLLGVKASFDELTPAIQPFLNGLTSALVAVQPLMVNLAGGIGEAAKQFGEFLSQAAKSGTLQEFFENGLAVLGDLGSILKNVTSIMGSFFDASTGQGATFLSNIKELTGQFASFLKSAEGSGALKALFELMRTLSSSVLDLIKPLLPLLGRVVQLLGTELGIVLKALSKVLEPVIKAFVDSFLPIFPKLISTAEQVAPIIAELAATLGAELGKALADLLPMFAQLILELLPIAIPVIKFLANVFKELAPNIHLIFIPLKIVLGAVLGLVTGIKALIKWLGDIDWKGIGSDIGGAFSKAWNAVKDFFAGVGKFFSELPGKIGDFLSSLPGKMVDLINLAFDGFIKGIGRGIGLVLSFFIETPQQIVNAISSLKDKLGAFLTGLWADTKAGVATGWNSIIEFFTGLPDKFVLAIGTARAKVGEFISGSIEFWKNTIVSGWNGIIDFIKSVPDKIGALKDFFLNAGKRIINGFMDGLKNVGNFIGDVAGSIVRTITNFLNRVINKLNEGIAEVDGFLPGSLPRIPNIALASGGLVTGPTNALIGEAGDEFVLPLQGGRARRAAEALGISGSNGEQNVVFQEGAISIEFNGVVPTESEARRTGEAVGWGITGVLGQDQVRTQVRVL